MSGWQSIPKPFLVASLAISALLNVLGLASIVEDAVTFASFLTNIIDVYRQYLRDPILNSIMYFWPTAWPRIPGWVIDVLVVQSSFFISYRLFMAFEKQQYLLSYFQPRMRIVQPVLVFLGGPLVPFVQLLRVRAKAKYEIKLAETEAEEAETARQQYSQDAATDLPILTPEGWLALDKRQLAGVYYLEAAKATFLKLNLYYGCYLIAVGLVLFIAYQFGRMKI